MTLERLLRALAGALDAAGIPSIGGRGPILGSGGSSSGEDVVGHAAARCGLRGLTLGGDAAY